MKEGRLVTVRTRQELAAENLELLYLEYMEADRAVQASA